MTNIKKSFTKGVAEKLRFYVYRLIDPRNGACFYIGKGKGNRVFAHVNGVLDEINKDAKKADIEDEDSAKIKLIKEIHGEDLEVIHLIHRHGMEEKTAYEVEAALIDATPGLAIGVSGHGADRGPMSVRQIERHYQSKVIESFPDKCLLIKIRQSTVDERGSVYEAVRSAWRLGKDKEQVKYVLAVVNGLVRAVYKNLEWTPYLDSGKWQFTGVEVNGKERNPYINHRVPELRKGAMAPVLYSWKAFKTRSASKSRKQPAL
jgi:hypothetical protein